MAEKPKDSRKQRSDGEGSLYPKHHPDCARPVNQHGSPKCKCPWVGAIVLGYIDGKPIRRKVQAPTRAAAANRLREKRDEYAEQQLPAAGKPMSVEKWMLYWLTQIAPRKVAAQTIQNSYDCKVRQYIVPLLGHHRLDRLTPEHIEAAWDHLRTVGNPKLGNDATPLSEKTVLQTHRILSRALKVAQQRKRVRANPADTKSMDAPTAKDKEMDVFTVSEVKAVLDAATADRLEARWVIALSKGLRQGEALGLRWEDVDLDDKVLRVRVGLQRIKGKGLVLGDLKTKGSRRDLALADEEVRILRAHKKAQTAERLAAGSSWHDAGLVFTQPNGKPIDPSRDSAAWHRLLDTAGVKQIRLHDARHSAATVMLLKGVDQRTVMDTLGHSQISVTAKYQHVVDEIKRDAAEAVAGALWG